MAEIKQVFILPTLPGIKRDGTMTDGDNFSDGQWVRWQRGRAKKMGGMQQMAALLSGPPRAVFIWPQGSLNNVLSFHGWGIDQISCDQEGLGGTVTDRTPAGMTTDTNLLWQVDQIFDSAGASSLILAQPSKTASIIDDNTMFPLYVGDPTLGTAFTAADAVNATSSGGVFATGPYAVLYGSNGYVKWSDANQPKTWTTGDSGSARVTGMKVVKGLPTRTGSGPGGLLWSLDSVLRMDYIGGAAIFRFSTLSQKSSIIAANSVIEYDGNYYWIGIDRFMVSNGAQIMELPNDMNLNWFFDNVNFSQRQKIWAMKVPRYGEIWWFFPFGTATECDHAVIFNVREKTWYDVALKRSAGYSSQVFHYPVMANNETERYTLLVTTITVGSFNIGDTLKGGTSGAMGVVNSVNAGNISIQQVNQLSFTDGETITNLTVSGTATLNSHRPLFDIYVHEKGHDLIEASEQTAIQAYFVTNDFGLPAGGPHTSQPPQVEQGGLNRWTRCVRVEPDFIMQGNMYLSIIGREFAQASDNVSQAYTFGPTTGKIDFREQWRSIRLRFESNTVGGHFEAGKVIIHTEPGDIRT